MGTWDDGSISCQPHHNGMRPVPRVLTAAHCLLEDSSKDLRLLIKHLLELLALEGASAHGRDNALNLLIKVVPRKSPKETDNSLSLWVIDQGEHRSVQHPSIMPAQPILLFTGFLISCSRPEEDPGGGQLGVWHPWQPACDKEQPDECLSSAEQALR